MADKDQIVVLRRPQDATLEVTLAPAQSVVGWTFAFALRAVGGNYNDAPLLTKTSGAGITVKDSANGVIDVALASADIKALGPGAYAWDFWRADAGFFDPLAFGQIVIRPGVWGNP